MNWQPSPLGSMRLHNTLSMGTLSSPIGCSKQPFRHPKTYIKQFERKYPFKSSQILVLASLCLSSRVSFMAKSNHVSTHLKSKVSLVESKLAAPEQLFGPSLMPLACCAPSKGATTLCVRSQSVSSLHFKSPPVLQRRDYIDGRPRTKIEWG